MAIDTVEKRLSIMDFGNIGFLYPTGNVNAAKRSAALGLYSGIALEGPVVTGVTIDGSSSKIINTDNGDCTIYFNGSNYFTYDSNVYYNY